MEARLVMAIPSRAFFHNRRFEGVCALLFVKCRRGRVKAKEPGFGGPGLCWKTRTIESAWVASACLPAPETLQIGTPCLFLAFNKPPGGPVNSIMPTYCVKIVALENGFFELHNFEGRCSKMPQLDQLILVGNHEDCYPAVVEAREHFKQVVGCPECCKACSVDL